MTLDRLPELDPDRGEVLEGELFAGEDVLVKVIALGPGAELPTHDHADATNVFHVLEGAVAVTQDGTTEAVEAPGVVVNERGTAHGATNETDERAVLTASLCPLP